jgi:hypothetical protein
MNKVEDFFERAIFAGRWFLAPMYVGLLAALVPLLYRFFHSSSRRGMWVAARGPSIQGRLSIRSLSVIVDY